MVHSYRIMSQLQILHTWLYMHVIHCRLSKAIKAADRLHSTYGQLQGWNHLHQVSYAAHNHTPLPLPLLQVTAVKVLLHLHNGDLVEANQVYSEAFRYVCPTVRSVYLHVCSERICHVRVIVVALLVRS